MKIDLSAFEKQTPLLLSSEQNLAEKHGFCPKHCDVRYFVPEKVYKYIDEMRFYK